MKRGFSLFPGIIFAFIALNMCIVAITVFLATSDRSAAVEPDYYQKAVAWDATALQREHNAKLGWKVALEAASVEQGTYTLTVRLADAAGNPVDGGTLRVVAFASVRASDRIELELSETAPGVYVAPLRVSAFGLWEYAITARARQEVFTARVSQDIPFPQAGERALRGGG